jgi:prepilin-type N-terminal cleavage/methylation domain-containing protein
MNIQIDNRQSTIGNRQSESGFSLTEVLIAIGLLAVGMLFVAGAFPVSIHFTAVATERTIAPIVADEAFAKLRIYFNDSNLNGLSNTSQGIAIGIPAAEFAYPSTPIPANEVYSKKYWWYPLFRRTNLTGNDVQVTIFVSRKVGMASQYLTDVNPTYPDYYDANRPDAIAVGVSGPVGGYELTIDTSINASAKTYISDGCTIVDDATGQIYRVLERYLPPNDNVIKLDRPWRPDLTPPQNAADNVWVVPPPVNSGRYPCIGVYQKVISF